MHIDNNYISTLNYNHKSDFTFPEYGLYLDTWTASKESGSPIVIHGNVIDAITNSPGVIGAFFMAGLVDFDDSDVTDGSDDAMDAILHRGGVIPPVIHVGNPDYSDVFAAHYISATNNYFVADPDESIVSDTIENAGLEEKYQWIKNWSD